MVPLKRICHFKINTEQELFNAIKKLQRLTFISNELQQDLYEIVLNRNCKHYLKLIRERGLRHGVSVIETDKSDLILIFYEFSKEGENHAYCQF